MISSKSIKKLSFFLSKSWKFWKNRCFDVLQTVRFQFFKKWKPFIYTQYLLSKHEQNRKITDFDELYTVRFNFPRIFCFFLRTLLFPLFVMKDINIFQVFPSFLHTNWNKSGKYQILMSSGQYDFTFPAICIFIKNAAVPSVAMEKNRDFWILCIFSHKRWIVWCGTVGVFLIKTPKRTKFSGLLSKRFCFARLFYFLKIYGFHEALTLWF